MTPSTCVAQRRPALVWALFHVPLFLALYFSSIARALGSVPWSYKFGLGFAYLAEAGFLAWIAWMGALPFSLGGRVYRFAAPAVTALLSVALAIDSRMYQALEFHVNGFFFRVLAQPGALQEVGVQRWELGAMGAGAVAWLVAELWGGSWFLGRNASNRHTAGWAALLLVLALAERLGTATMSFYGGPAIFAAGQVLPLIPPLRMNRTLARLTGRPRMSDPFDGERARLSVVPVPEGLTADSVHFTRTPDIIFALVESLRSDFLDPRTMPRMARRAAAGAEFTHHYAGATSTHFSLFSIFYGLQSQKFDAVVGAGRRPLLFDALRANGYQMRLVAASNVDWMNLKRTVFGAVEHDLETEFQGSGDQRDAAMLVRAQQFVQRADHRPLFLFLFFDGTHFSYSFPARSARFRPYWEGGGSLEAGQVAPASIERRARNSAYEVDWKLDDFLTWFAAKRGGQPLVLIAGDHGEEFGEQGHLGHSSAVTEPQVHVTMVLLDSTIAPGRRTQITSHLDLVPTILGLLGDTHPPASYSDGLPMFTVPPGRFVLTSVGWEPRFAVIGADLKVTFNGLDAGLGRVSVTDACDRPLTDPRTRFEADALNILRAFRSRPPVALPNPPSAPLGCP